MRPADQRQPGERRQRAQGRGIETSLEYVTLDYQLKANYVKNLSVTAGIKNLLKQGPPFSVRNSGGGNQVGYDGRYAAPLGRQFYLVAG
ncbi:TonB-dependent receptor [Rugamonas sp. CCM 8940]|uniref:TonB-dependent receptor n=1 Tax=Rugamonas sp. CCM 8940 TaxID=2765359 RepID=UPI001F31E8E0|nr:TonB-dependent receptor [Rugamonas sp. CCM 8940]